MPGLLRLQPELAAHAHQQRRAELLGVLLPAVVLGAGAVLVRRRHPVARVVELPEVVRALRRGALRLRGKRIDRVGAAEAVLRDDPAQVGAVADSGAALVLDVAAGTR